MHGLGNDFVIINRDLYTNIDHAFAKKIIHRNIGIGCDQLITYACEDNVYKLDIWNADGTLAGVCGNGIRCVAQLLWETTEKRSFKMRIRQNVVTTEIIKNEVVVNMGTASFNHAWIPEQKTLDIIAESYGMNRENFICGDIGIKHLVLLNYDQKAIDIDVAGHELSTHNIFKPDGINVNFTQIINGEIFLDTFEYGTGFTYACGSGACVAFAIAYKKGLVDRKTYANFKLGKLALEFNDRDEILMTGSAIKIADGVYYG